MRQLIYLFFIQSESPVPLERVLELAWEELGDAVKDSAVVGCLIGEEDGMQDYEVGIASENGIDFELLKETLEVYPGIYDVMSEESRNYTIDMGAAFP